MEASAFSILENFAKYDLDLLAVDDKGIVVDFSCPHQLSYDEKIKLQNIVQQALLEIAEHSAMESLQPLIERVTKKIDTLKAYKVAFQDSRSVYLDHILKDWNGEEISPELKDELYNYIHEYAK